MAARRIDYLDHPNAPVPKSVVPSVNVVVVRDDGAILLIRRTDNDNYASPGGGMDLGESMPQAAVGETKEETGVDVEITRLVGIYTNPRHLIEYTSTREVRQEFSIVFTHDWASTDAQQRVVRGRVGRPRGDRPPAHVPEHAPAHRALSRTHKEAFDLEHSRRQTSATAR